MRTLIVIVACASCQQLGCTVENDQPSTERHPTLEENAAGDDDPPDREWQPGDGFYVPGAECKRVSLTDDHFANPGESANDAGVPLAALRVDRLPEWSLEQLQPAFNRIRDERFLCDPLRPDFARRLTWLDPNQGCEMRAELVGWKLAEWGYSRPFKIFLFGPMQVSTPNTPSGSASWSWHVASAVRVGKIAYVFDAAVEPRRPLTLDEWTQRLIPRVEDLKAAVCDSAAFQPASTCFGGPAWSTPTAIHFEQSFFAAEWKLQLALGRDPERSLGDAPPWAM
jgi:hypothetical protein